MADQYDTTFITHMTNSTSLDGLLKEVYLPTMQNTLYNDTRLSQLIQPRQIEGGGNRIVHFALTQGAEGTGTIEEGGTWVNNVPIKGKQMTENTKTLNSHIKLSGQIIHAANSGVKSAVNAVTKSFETNIIAFKNNFDRMLVGQKDGVLATIDSVTLGSAYVTVTGKGYSPAQYVQPGTHLRILEMTGSTITGERELDTDDENVGYVDYVTTDLSAGTARIYMRTSNDGTVIDAAGGSSPAAADVLVRNSAYGSITASSTSTDDILEPNGLNNLVSDGSSNSETANQYKYIWPSDSNGIDRTAGGYAYAASYMKDFSSNDLSEDNLLDLLMDMQFARQARPDILLVTPKAEKQYFLGSGNALQGDRRFNSVGQMHFVGNITGGYDRLGIQLGDHRMMITSLASVPKNTLFLLQTKDFAFAQNAPFTWVLGDGGNVLIQSHDGYYKFAAAVQEMNLVCFDPYRQAKGYNVSES